MLDFQEIRDTSPLGLKSLNDQLRLLWVKSKDGRVKDLNAEVGEKLNISSNVSITSKVSNGDLESALTIRDDAISLKAAQTSLNATNIRVTTAEASITVQAGQITTKVSSAGVISAINQTAEQITISANKIGLLGLVNIPNLTADKIAGLNLTLGGVNNGSGVMTLLDNTGATIGTLGNAGINLFNLLGTYSAKYVNGAVSVESRIWGGATTWTYTSISAPATNTSIKLMADPTYNWLLTTGQTIFLTDGSDISISYGLTVGGALTVNGSLTVNGAWLGNNPVWTIVTNLALQNSWVAQSGWLPVAYSKDKFGWVSLRGVCVNGVTANSTLIFTLPSGYRPINGTQCFQIGATDRIAISSTGNVTINVPTGASSWLDFSVIRFHVGV